MGAAVPTSIGQTSRPKATSKIVKMFAVFIIVPSKKKVFLPGARCAHHYRLGFDG
jgi:hypothetical protein